MSRAEIETAVIAILAKQLLLPPEEIAATAEVDDLGLDSLGKVEIQKALRRLPRLAARVAALEKSEPEAE